MHVERILLQPELWALAWQRHGTDTLALRPDNVAELRAHLENAQSSAECRAVILLSLDADDFCLGMDLSLLDPNLLDPSSAKTNLGSDFARVLELLHSGSFASLALIDGKARGGGVGLAAACDFVVATPKASFALPELLWGLIPAVIYPTLNLRLSAAKTRWLALAGETLDGPRACELGLVDQIVEDREAAQREIRQHLRMILREDPEAIARTKALARATYGHSLPDAQIIALDHARSNLQRPELASAYQAFNHGELPPWSRKLTAFDWPHLREPLP